MTTVETGTGRRIDIHPPPPGIWEELDAVADVYRKLLKDRSVTGTRLGGLRGDLERAKDDEIRQLAKALKDDKPPPKLSKVQKITRDIEVCEQRLAALEEAIDLATGELIEAVDEHREAWTEDALDRVAEAKTAYQEAVEQVDVASQEMLAQIALLRWARQFPEQETSYRIRGSNVLALVAPHGDAYSLSEVVQALRENANVTYDPRAFISRDPIAAQAQAEFEERMRNEEAGLGHFTDAQLALKDADPASFYGGAGARLIHRMGTGDLNGNEEGEENG